MQPFLKAGVGGDAARRDGDTHAEHRLAAHPFQPFDAAHQVDEHHGGQRKADDGRDGRDANDQDRQRNPQPHYGHRRAGDHRRCRNHADVAGRGGCGVGGVWHVDRGWGCWIGGDCNHAFQPMDIAGHATWRFPETLAGENPHAGVISGALTGAERTVARRNRYLVSASTSSSTSATSHCARVHARTGCPPGAVRNSSMACRLTIEPT